MRKTVLRSCVLVLASAALASCPMDLRSYVEVLQIREALGPIAEILMNSTGDTFGMGESPTETAQTFTYSFLISKYEITNTQFAKFIDDGGYTTQSYWTTNGWNWKLANSATQPLVWTDTNFNGPSQPVAGVNWYEAVAFCNWRSVRERLVAAYDSTGRLNMAASGYRLPTEVEWEYAAAKGAPGQAERLWAYGNVSDASKEVCFPAAPKPGNVGSKSPGGDTPQGLADMSGNMAEWCSDNLLAPTPATDRYYFTGDPPAVTLLVYRGGYWSGVSDPNSRCAAQAGQYPDVRFNYLGFRTARRR